MDKFKNKYRIASTRLPNWDYGSNALYFVTICTHHRICHFGNVSNGKMNLSSIGIIVTNEWLKTFEIRPDMNLFMGEYIVMPNHFHAIIGIGENQYNTNHDKHGGRDAMHCVYTNAMHCDGGRDAMYCDGGRDAMHCDGGRDAMHCVSTDNENTNSKYKNQFGPQSKNLASIIRGFKIGVTKNARIINPDFEWQSRYHDHIIRNDKSYLHISNYIEKNPIKWTEDRFFYDKNRY